MHGQWLESLKMKFVTTDVSTLQQLLLSKVEDINEIKKNREQQFNEDEIQIKELTSKVDTMKEALHAETQVLESKNKELLKENNFIEELQIENKKLLQEIKQLEAERNSLKSSKPNLQDQQLLECGRKKLKLYKELTHIQWDYGASKQSIKGYVSNGSNYIKHFCYENRDINSKLVDSLWHEIYLSTSQGENERENLQPNFAK